MKSTNRKTWRWQVRYWIAWKMQKSVWALQDPYDSWVIDYTSPEGFSSMLVHKGPYSNARIRCRELSGKIVGHSAIELRDDDNYQSAEYP